MDSKVILEAQDLCKSFYTRDGGVTHALNHVSLKLYSGEVLALIGESGSGKSTLGRALLRLLPLDHGDILWKDQSILNLKGAELRTFRQYFQMIFQNQQANLHPRMNVEQMLDESLRLHRSTLDQAQRQSKIESLLEEVGLTQHHHRYIASLSGGEQRRVGLARILATQPTLIIADEPTSGLDAAIKLQMIELLNSIKGSDLTYLLISHDLNLVRSIADRVLVMLRGRLIEEIDINLLGKIQHHPYTEKLLAAADLGDHKIDINSGSIEDLTDVPANACPFVHVCPWSVDTEIKAQCLQTMPSLQTVNTSDKHRVACWKLQRETQE